MLRNRTPNDIAGAGDVHTRKEGRNRADGNFGVRRLVAALACRDSSRRNADRGRVRGGKAGASSRTPKMSLRCASLASKWLTLALLCCLGGPLRAQAPAPHHRGRLRSAIRGELSRRAKPAGRVYPDLHLGGRPPRIEAGRVAFARGGLMRWDYSGPRRSSLSPTASRCRSISRRNTSSLARR